MPFKTRMYYLQGKCGQKVFLLSTITVRVSLCQALYSPAAAAAADCDYRETFHEMMQVDVFMRHFVDSIFTE